MSKSTKVDQKGRLKIPAGYADGFKDMGDSFFITSEDGQSARIYPLRIWNEIEKRLVRLATHNRNMQKMLLRAKYFGQTVTMDEHGRVLIPLVLRKTALMRGEVDVFGFQNYLEVWNHVRLVKNLNRSPFTERDEILFERLAS
jgi:MraZ protein